MKYAIIGLLIVGGLISSGFYFIDSLGDLSVDTWFLPVLIISCAVFMLVGLAAMKQY